MSKRREFEVNLFKLFITSFPFRDSDTPLSFLCSMQVWIFLHCSQEPFRLKSIYNRLSLSRLRLSGTITYIVVKTGNLTKGNKILWKKGEKCSFFHNIFNLCLTSAVKLYIHLWNMLVRFIFFLSSANLICQGTDISKYFRESLGFRDNKSWLYVFLSSFVSQEYALMLLTFTVRIQVLTAKLGNVFKILSRAVWIDCYI